MRFVTADGAAELVPNAATIAICGSAKVGVPEQVLRALGERYHATQAPRKLTLYFPVEPADRPGVGFDHLAQPGMIDCLIGGSFVFTGSGAMAATTRLIVNDEVAAYNLPMGIMYLLLRDVAAGRPGHITDVGMGTFVEPALSGGKLTTHATRDLVEYVRVGDKRYLRYLPVPIDVALIRGTSADEYGNIALEHEASQQGMLVMAEAAKKSGGIVIAQVRRKVPARSLPRTAVRVPDMLIDAVVVAPDQEQLLGEPFHPELCGPDPADVRALGAAGGLSFAAGVVLRRALREIASSDRINVGFGLSAYLPLLAQDKIRNDDVRFFVEQGAAGGVPLPGALFGTSANPDALIDMPSWFDYLDGGAFTKTFLGFGQVDGSGSVNNHRFGSILSGCGGFIDITAHVPKIVFCGTFTTGGLRCSYRDGGLAVDREGRHDKFVADIGQPTLSGLAALKRGQDVMWITERAVFELRADGLTVTELAPGLRTGDLEAAAGCHLEFAPRLTEMGHELFGESMDRIGVA